MGLDAHLRCAASMGFLGLWERRTTIEIEGAPIDMMSLPDLVQAKKTHRLTDWPMIQHLVEASWYAFRAEPSPERIDVWLRECRKPALLLEKAARFPDQATGLSPIRSPVASALCGAEEATRALIEEEQKRIMEEDRIPWAPLKLVIEKLRRSQPL